MYFYGVLINVVLCFVVMLSVSPTKAQKLAKESSKEYELTPKNLNKTAHEDRTLKYVESPDNPRHVPFQQQSAVFRKKLPKSPKRTVQKIIKKQKSRKKLGAWLSSTVVATTKQLVQSIKYKATTLEPHRRKWHTKVARYHMPFQKLQKQKRAKRRMQSELFFPEEEVHETMDTSAGMNSANGNNYRDLYDKFHLWN